MVPNQNTNLVLDHTRDQTKSGRLLNSLLSLTGNSLGGIGDLVLQFLHGLFRRAVLATAVVDDPSDLDDTDTAEEEVDGSEAACISGVLSLSRDRIQPYR